LFSAIAAFFQLYNGENKLISNDMMMMHALYYITILIVLAHWNNSPRIDMLLHSVTFTESLRILQCQIK